MAMNNPYRIRENLYCIEHIMSFGLVRSFLVIGNDKALLIDTGLGRDDLRSVVEEITDLPIEVIYTHSDGDHVGGAEQFNKSYMHPIEIEHYKKRFEKAQTMIELNEKDLVSCGEYSFEVIHIPGHTPGSIALFERKHRFIIGGDSLQVGPIFMFGNGRNVDDYLKSLEKVYKLVNDVDVSQLQGKELRRFRRNIGMVFQSFNLVKRTSVIKNVLAARVADMPLWMSLLSLYSKQDKIIALEALDQVGILEKAYVRADQLSGGQQQRVALARCLAQKPSIILADEPVASLTSSLINSLTVIIFSIFQALLPAKTKPLSKSPLRAFSNAFKMQ
jgi:energy-coupling factor transporter ATP-binding protein EcfA2